MVTVNKYGTVNIVGGGDTVITITAAETDDYKKASVDITLTVRYKIKYQLNKGKNNSKNPTSYYKQSIVLKNPTRKDYAFKGWYTDKNFKKKITKITTKTAKNLTLYAKWEKISVGKTEITSLKNVKGKKIQIKLKGVKKADGYQVAYSTSKTFRSNKKIAYTKEKTTILKSLKKIRPTM